MSGIARTKSIFADRICRDGNAIQFDVNSPAIGLKKAFDLTFMLRRGFAIDLYVESSKNNLSFEYVGATVHVIQENIDKSLQDNKQNQAIRFASLVGICFSELSLEMLFLS